jgi:hypothetical protein
MTKKFILWAQALDNTSPDHLDVRGNGLSAGDSSQRQKAVSLLSSVTKNGVRVYEFGSVLLTADDCHFVLEIPSAQRDLAGRIAPIVCYGDYDAAVVGVLGDSAVAALDDFAKRIGRTLQPDHIEHAHESFEALKKKSSMTKLVRMVKIWAVVLVFLVLAFVLLKRGW